MLNRIQAYLKEFSYIHRCFEDTIAISRGAFETQRSLFKVDTFIKETLGLVKM